MSAADPTARRPRLGVWKFTSCDGCQLTLLDCEEDLVEVLGAVEVAHFVEAGPRSGPEERFDVSFVEGSITTAEDLSRLRQVRERSDVLVTIGACATAGGIQALRNFGDVSAMAAAVYPRPELLSTLDTSTPVADHVRVDVEVRGCPIDRGQLIELISALLAGRRPQLPTHSVCVECKGRGVTCLPVRQGTPCLGPVTQAGCGALCPSYDRGCYGCFGPSESASVGALAAFLTGAGVAEDDVVRSLRTFNAWAPANREVSVGLGAGRGGAPA